MSLSPSTRADFALLRLQDARRTGNKNGPLFVDATLTSCSACRTRSSRASPALSCSVQAGEDSGSRPPALAQWVHVDVMCYIQLGPTSRMKATFPTGSPCTWSLGMWRLATKLLPFCELFKKGVASDQPAMKLQEAGEAISAGHVQRFRCGELAPERWHPRVQRGGSKTSRTRSCCAHGKRRPGSTTPS